MTARRVFRVLTIAATLTAAACASNPPAPVVTTPKFPSYPSPDIPPALRVSADLRARHETAWLRLQSGDVGGASRDYSAILKKQPDFYPSEAGLGFANLADRQFKNAAAHFTAVVAKNDRYLPAWIGKADAELELHDDDQAIASMERVLAIDPTRDAIRSRLALVRFRDVQADIDAGRRARAAGKFDESEQSLQAALRLSPTSPVIPREMALTENAAGNGDAAEASARKAVSLDPRDPENSVTLSDVLEARGKYRDAAAALAKAVAIDPRPEWRTRLASLRDRADLAALPANFDALPHAASVSRAEVAAYVGIKLRPLIEAAPHHVAPVMTDVRAHWAAPWITSLAETGVMSAYANHTFQPAATVHRGDLARVAAELVTLAAGSAHQADLARWRAARPKFPDMPATNVLYRSAAIATAAGAMTTAPDGRFDPARPATGADLVQLVARVNQLDNR